MLGKNIVKILRLREVPFLSAPIFRASCQYIAYKYQCMHVGCSKLDIEPMTIIHALKRCAHEANAARNDYPYPHCRQQVTPGPTPQTAPTNGTLPPDPTEWFNISVSSQ